MSYLQKSSRTKKTRMAGMGDDVEGVVMVGECTVAAVVSHMMGVCNVKFGRSL